MRNFWSTATWPVGLIAFTLTMTHLLPGFWRWFDSLACIERAPGACIFPALLGLLLWLLAAPGWIIQWFVGYLFGVAEDASYAWLTLLAIFAYLGCLIGANPGRAFDLSTDAASHALDRKIPPGFIPNRTKRPVSTGKTVKEETNRQSARAEMEEAIREHEKAKARLDALHESDH